MEWRPSQSMASCLVDSNSQSDSSSTLIPTCLVLTLYIPPQPWKSIHCITLPSLFEIPEPLSLLTFWTPAEATLNPWRHLWFTYTYSLTLSPTEEYSSSNIPLLWFINASEGGVDLSSWHCRPSDAPCIPKRVQHCIIGVRSYDSFIFSFLRDLARAIPSVRKVRCFNFLFFFFIADILVSLFVSIFFVQLSNLIAFGVVSYCSGGRPFFFIIQSACIVVFSDSLIDIAGRPCVLYSFYARVHTSWCCWGGK